MLHLLQDGGLFALGTAALTVVGLVAAVLQLLLAGRVRLAPLVLGALGVSLAVGVTGTGLGVLQTMRAMATITGPHGPLTDASLSISIIPTQVACLGGGLVALLWGAGAALDRTIRAERRS